MVIRSQQRRVPLLDLGALHAPLQAEIGAEVQAVIDSQQFIHGEAVGRLESAIAGLCGTAHAVGCASGSDALYLALLGYGVQPGDEVLTTPFSFFATAGAISRVGATPVFVDIDAGTFNLEPASLEESAARHSGAKAIIAVDLFGGCADMDPIRDIAQRYGMRLIEDGAQAIGAEYLGRPALGLGDVGCLSFFPTKNLGGWGDGGMMTTDDGELAGRLRALREHGSRVRYIHDWVGVNSRLDTLQAAVLLAKLPHLADWTEARQANARRYREQLAGSEVGLPVEAGYQTRHVYNQFVIRCPRRDELQAYLADCGIGTAVYYPVPLHLQPCYRGLGYREGELPEAERAAAEVLALPVHPMLAEEDVVYVAGAIRAFYEG